MMAMRQEILNYEYNEALVHQVVTTYLTNARAGTKAQKTRAQVRGGGKKPWKQKGTGRARAGTIRSPLWRKGGVIFAASPRDFTQKINKKMFNGAMCSMLAELNRQQRLVFVDTFKLEQPKTKALLALLKDYQDTKLTIVAEFDNENLYLAAQNLINVIVCSANQLSPLDLIKSEKVIITADSVKKIDERFGGFAK
jgi:large subunit ribosomal protein L4